MSDTLLPIEKGIPIPPRINARNQGRRLGSPNLIPWKHLEVGDSVFVPEDLISRRCVVVMASKARTERYSNRDFAVRYVEGGTRVWRIA